MTWFRIWRKPHREGLIVFLQARDSFEPASRVEWDQLKALLLFEQDWKCCHCGKSILWNTSSFDHLIPRIQQGTDHKANLGMSCVRCNSSKGGRNVWEWVEPEDYAASREEQ